MTAARGAASARGAAASSRTAALARRARSRRRSCATPPAAGWRDDVSRETVVSFIGVPYDGAATLGWPGARYAPEDVRRQLAWMRMRVQAGRIYWGDEDREVSGSPEQL